MLAVEGGTKMAATSQFIGSLISNSFDTFSSLLGIHEEVQEQVQRSEGDGNMLREYLEKNHGFEPAHLETLYKYSQILFDIGKYQEAEIILYQYFILSSDPQKTFAVRLG